MAKHRPRFLPKALIGMGAVTGLAVMMPTPARAASIELICNYGSLDSHVYIDTNRRSVDTYINGNHYGPFVASISDTLIRWVELEGDGPHQFTIDRVAGTFREIIVRKGEGISDGKCRRATQKF